MALRVSKLKRGDNQWLAAKKASGIESGGMASWQKKYRKRNGENSKPARSA